MNDTPRTTYGQRHAQRIEHDRGVQRRRHRPADDPAAEHIEDNRQVQEARPCRNVGDIGHPKHIRCIGREPTVDQIRRLTPTITHRCDRKLAAADTSNAGGAHEPRNTVLADPHAVRHKLGMDPRCTIGSARHRVDRTHRLGQRSIRTRPPGGRTHPPRIVAAAGNAQHSAHGGYRKFGLVRAHESEPFGGITSVSRANQAAAFERMSRSSLSCLTSRRRRLISSRSAVVTPSSRRPASRSACTTQFRIACAVGSNSFARLPDFARIEPARSSVA